MLERAGKKKSRRGLTLVEIIIVIIIIGIIMVTLGSLASNIAFLRSTEDEAQTLRSALNFCRTAAIKSNQEVYFEINLDENFYRAYRYKRSQGELEKDYFLTKRSLADSNSILAVMLAGGVQLKKGQITIPFIPGGANEEIAIYLGQDPVVNTTVILNRFGVSSQVFEGEKIINLEDESWEEDLEKY